MEEGCWLAYHVFHTDVERVIGEVIAPWRVAAVAVERRYWERHYAGGRHVRVRLRGQPASLAEAGLALERAVAAFLAASPGAIDPGYSPARAAQLLARERGQVDATDLTYRTNVCERHAYAGPETTYPSPEARELAITFRHDVMPVAEAVLAAPVPRLELALALYAVQAQVACGDDLREGFVSAKSHWEGFAAAFPAEVAVERVRETYARHRDGARRVIESVECWTRDGAAEVVAPLGGAALLGAWRALLTTYATRVTALLAEGVRLTDQPSTPAHAREVRAQVHRRMSRDSAFIQTLWADERFMASVQFEPAFLVPRMLVNLFYMLLPLVGLNPIDKMAVCYFAHRTIEERDGCDLNDILRRNIAAVSAAHAHRWA